MPNTTHTLRRIRAYARRELVFLALGAMDMCVIAPVYGALLAPLINVQPLPIAMTLLAGLMIVHYLARLSFTLPIDFRLRSGLTALAMLTSGLLAVQQVLYAQATAWHLSWLGDVFESLKQDTLSRDIMVFLLAVFLWWRGLVLAQRRLDSASVAFRFRLGVILLAVTSGIAGSMHPWPYHRFVFAFFFASLLGIAVARAEEVGQQYGGRQSPFSLGWLATLVTASAVVLLVAAGLTSLLTAETLGRILRPILGLLQILLFLVVYAFAWAAQLVLEPLLGLLGQHEIVRALEEVFDQIRFPQPRTGQSRPTEPIFKPEQLATIRVTATIVGASVVVLVVAVSLYRLRARSSGPSNEERESVWEGVHLASGLTRLLKLGRRRLGGVAAAVVHSRLGRAFAALTIRRIYAHMAQLAARRGYPRAIDETPYDYLPTLREAFPENQDEVEQITESYVAVHYGELPERREDLYAVRSAWRQIEGRTLRSFGGSRR